MSPLANYSTTVSAQKTVAEITAILVAHKAQSILTNYKNEEIESLSFIIPTAYGDMPIKLPVNVEAVQKVLNRQCRSNIDRQRALRVAWRILKDWLRAQCAIVDTEMVKMEQVFLSYTITPSNKTLYEVMVDNKFQLSKGITNKEITYGDSNKEE